MVMLLQLVNIVWWRGFSSDPVHAAQPNVDGSGGADAAAAARLVEQLEPPGSAVGLRVPRLPGVHDAALSPVPGRPLGVRVVSPQAGLLPHLPGACPWGVFCACRACSFDPFPSSNSQRAKSGFGENSQHCLFPVQVFLLRVSENDASHGEAGTWGNLWIQVSPRQRWTVTWTDSGFQALQLPVSRRLVQVAGQSGGGDAAPDESAQVHHHAARWVHCGRVCLRVPNGLNETQKPKPAATHILHRVRSGRV